MLYLHFFFCLFVCLPKLQAVEIQTLVNVLHQGLSPFAHPLDLKIYAGKSPKEEAILCCHGYGGDSSIAGIIASYRTTPAHLIGFNFPDYNITSRKMNPSQMAYGTISELLPAIYLLKKIVVDAQAKKVSLYGFSSGGAAVVNLVSLLNTAQNNQQLMAIGVSKDDTRKILAALQKGIILLDAPLKSIDEYNAAHPASLKDPLHAAQAKRYRENGMNPIDSLAKWEGLNLSVVVFFQTPDEAISNRDDVLFAERLRKINPHGRNLVLSGSEGGHLGFHYSLWKGYSQLN